MRAMGVAPAAAYEHTAREALAKKVVLPLARRGIAIDVVSALVPREGDQAAA